MVCAIHQPQYLPWLGYFHKMALCDVFILLDDVQYKKNEWQNRNRIRTAQGEQFLTVPVHYRFPHKINEVGIDDRSPWAKKHLTSLEMNYGRAPHYAEYAPGLSDLLLRPWKNLADLNGAVVVHLAGLLGISCKILTASTLASAGSSTERLLSLCRTVGADTYLSGSGGRGYLDESLFKNAGVRLDYQAFTPPVYPQLPFRDQPEFMPGLAVVDLLFNCGPRSLDVLKGAPHAR